MVGVNESFTDPKTKQVRPVYRIDWPAFRAMQEARHPAFDHMSDADAAECLKVVQDELCTPVGARFIEEMRERAA